MANKGPSKSLAGRPGPHPLPPPDLATRRLPILQLTGPWYRIHRVGHAARYWGLNPPRRHSYRWDSPTQSFGVLYLGVDGHAAFIETFGHNTGIRLIETTDLHARCLSGVTATRIVNLVHVSGPHLAHLGADARLFTGDYDVSQQWAKAFDEHPQQPDGIYYPSRHDPNRACVALFDRAQGDVFETLIGTLADRQLAPQVADWLNTYGVGIT